MFKYPISQPQLDGNELSYAVECLKSGWISSKGEYVAKFESAFSDYHKALYGISCSSGTNALILALRACNIGKGDEVIIPEFTMIATAWAVTIAGARPVFVDCGNDLNIDVSLIEGKITKRTRAIIPVHVYGRVCDIDAINQIAHDYNLYVIEDSCEAHGTKVRGDIACFSLFANKIITAGEGGICITNDKRLAKQIRHLSSMAFDNIHSFLHKKLSYNFRFTALQAAVALAQIERVNEFLGKRKQIEKWYDEGLSNMHDITLMAKRDVVWHYDLLCDKRDDLVKYLKEQGIETRVYFKPMSAQPMYFDESYLALKAWEYAKCGLYLPTHTCLTKNDVDYIINEIKQFYS